MTRWVAALPFLAGLGIAAAPAGPGDPVAGERAYQKCYACHALEPGRNDLTGPSLHRIVGRPVAGQPGFPYSDALRSFARRHPRWTAELINRYAADPEGLVPGTDMTFTGMRDAGERADLIAFLRAQ